MQNIAVFQMIGGERIWIETLNSNEIHKKYDVAKSKIYLCLNSNIDGVPVSGVVGRLDFIWCDVVQTWQEKTGKVYKTGSLLTKK